MTDQTDTRQAMIEEAKTTGWLDMYASGGTFGSIDTVCVWCGCIVRTEFKDIHRLKCTQPPGDA